MTIYVYAPKIKPGTRELIAALGATRLIKFDGLRLYVKGKPITFAKDDVIICWGYSLPPISNVRIFNSNLNISSPITLYHYVAKYTNSHPCGVFTFVPIPTAGHVINISNELIRYEDPNEGSMITCRDIPGYGMPAYYAPKNFVVEAFKTEINFIGLRVGQNVKESPLLYRQIKEITDVWNYSRLQGFKIIPQDLPIPEGLVHLVKELNLDYVSLNITNLDRINLGYREFIQKITTAPNLYTDADVERIVLMIKRWINEG